MPRYDYECSSCGHVFELRQSFDAEPTGECPRCAGMSRRKFHAVPIIYKGSGFYTTDYKRSGTSGTSDTTQEKDGKDNDGKEKDGAKPKTEAAKATTGASDEKVETSKSTSGDAADK